MTLSKERNFSLLMILTLVLSMILPQVALAYTTIGDASSPTLTVHKFEQEPGTPEGDAGDGSAGQTADGTPVEGVTYELKQTHKYNADTDKWEEFDGPTLTKETGTNGQLTFTTGDGLELGRYTVQETAGPAHVILNPDVFTVDIPMTNATGDELNYDVHIYPKNETVRGDAEIIKKSETGEILPGVTFGLYEEAGTPLDENLTTGLDGKAGFEGLAAGKYYFQEIATVEGHALNTTKINFEVKNEAGDSVVIWEDSDINEGNEVTNYKVPEIVKDVEDTTHHEVDRDTEFVYNIGITTPGDVHRYKKIAVTDTLDSRLEYAGTWSVTGTDAGNIEFTSTPVGDTVTLKWSVKDLSVLTPNQEIKITFTAKIKPDAELELGESGIPNQAELEFDNDNGEETDPEDPPTTPPVTVDPTEGGVKVVKVDASDNNVKLEGAEFKLTTDAAGNDVVDATGTVITVNGIKHNALLQDLVTGAEGTFTIDGLTPGTYYLHETKAPTYMDEGVQKAYNLLKKPVEVIIVNKIDSNDNEVTVENSKSGWNLPTTGGIGTILFTAIGFMFMGMALFLLFRRNKRMQA